MSDNIIVNVRAAPATAADSSDDPVSNYADVTDSSLVVEPPRLSGLEAASLIGLEAASLRQPYESKAEPATRLNSALLDIAPQPNQSSTHPIVNDLGLLSSGNALTVDEHTVDLDGYYDVSHIYTNLDVNAQSSNAQIGIEPPGAPACSNFTDSGPYQMSFPEDTIDWTFLNDPVVPLGLPGFGHNIQMALPPTPFPKDQSTVLIQGLYQPIAPAITRTATIRPHPSAGINLHQAIHETRIRCTERGCTKTFRRPGDYRRHMRKHQAPNFKCIEIDCNLKFYRLDKLRDHLRQGHKINL